MSGNLQHLAEYLAIRGVATVANALPYRAALCVGWLNAAMMFGLARFRVREAKRRIRQVFGESLSPGEVSRIAWLSWRNITFNGIEMMRVGRMNLPWATTHADYGAYVDTMKSHLATGRGAIVAIPHMGSWELGSVVSKLHGLPVFSIGGKQRNPYVNAYIDRLRRAPGIDILERGSGTMRDVLRKLRAGGVLGILPDVRIPTPGVQVPFLGGMANLGKGMALFAIHAEIPVFPAITCRDGWTRHRIVLFDPIQPNPDLPVDEEISRITGLVMQVIETAIRRDPGQWFWFNKRWILDPVPSPCPASRSTAGGDPGPGEPA